MPVTTTGASLKASAGGSALDSHEAAVRRISAVMVKDLGRLGLDGTRRRQSAAAVVLSHAPVVTARLDLETLGTPRGFTVRHLREGSLPTYRLAFLLTDYLIARDGLAGIVEYFRLCSGRRDRGGHFRRAFGQRLAEFEREALARLATLAP